MSKFVGKSSWSLYLEDDAFSVLFNSDQQPINRRWRGSRFFSEKCPLRTFNFLTVQLVQRDWLSSYRATRFDPCHLKVFLVFFCLTKLIVLMKSFRCPGSSGLVRFLNLKPGRIWTLAMLLRPNICVIHTFKKNMNNSYPHCAHNKCSSINI